MNDKGKKNILVTGGAGFIGSNLCKALIEKGHKVFSLDNYSTGSEKNHVNGVEYIKGDTSKINTLINFSPDIVYHLGEYSRVEKSFDDFDMVWSSNIIGTQSVINFCLQKKSKLIYAASSTKFGDCGAGMNQSPYGWTKGTNTQLVVNYGDWFGLNFAITYFYNVYGPNEISSGEYATLIAIFKKQMSNNEDLTVVSPGTQRRNFTDIRDIVSGLIIVAEKGSGDGFGIGCDKAYSVLEVAELFGGKIRMLPERRGNRMDAEVISKKTQRLGWKANYSLSNYIQQLNSRNWESN